MFKNLIKMSKEKFGNKGITISFGNRAENSYSMNAIGESDHNGFEYKDLKRAANYIKNAYGFNYKLYDLRQCFKNSRNINELPKAHILVVKGIFKAYSKQFFKSLSKDKEKIKNNTINSVEWDKHEYSRYTKNVCNLRARYKLCFSNLISSAKREAKYEKKDGTIYKIDCFPIMNIIYLIVKDILYSVFGEDVEIHAEGNYYYDLSKTYIGMHRDRERSLTIGCRFGESFPMFFGWYKGSTLISDIFSLSNIENGDLYIMCNFACGNLVKNQLYLKHGAGNRKYVLPKNLNYRKV